MKKLMMMVVVALVAGMSQAASVVWNSGAIKTPLSSPDGAFGTSIGTTVGAYLVTVTFFTDAGGTSPVGGVTGNSSGSSSALSQFTATTSSSFTPSTDYYAQMVITQTGGKYQMTSTIAEFLQPSTGSAGINFTTGTGFVTVSDKMPTQWTDLEPVPEPASMALFGLGAGVLALRRRFMKKA